MTANVAKTGSELSTEPSLKVVTSFTYVKFVTFTARNAVNDVGGGACKIVPNNEIGFRPLFVAY